MDSVIALFRVDFTGRGELAERQVELQKISYDAYNHLIFYPLVLFLFSEISHLSFAAKTGTDALPVDKNSRGI